MKTNLGIGNRIFNIKPETILQLGKMCKEVKIILISLFCFSCSGQYFIKKDKSGEPIVSLNLYSLNKKMNIDDSKKIDTTALYVRLDMIHSDNPEILIFHNDGFYESQGKKFFRKFEKDRKKILCTMEVSFL